VNGLAGRWLAVACWALTVLLSGVTVALFRGRVLKPPPTDPPGFVGEVLFILLPVAFGSLGAVLERRRRDNPIGWILSAGMLCVAWYSFATGYADLELVKSPDARGALLAGWLTNWLWMPGPLAIAVSLQLFPDGRVLGPRWGLAIWATLFGFLISALTAALAPGGLGNIPSVDNPFGWQTLTGLGDAALALGGLMELVAFGLACASVLVRFRHSRGIERQQLKWLAFAGSLLPLVAVVNGSTPFIGPWAMLSVWIAAYTIPIAIGLAILRYRLYEIDLIIRRTLVYAVLTAGLGAVYWVGVVVLQQGLRAFTQGSDLALVASTLAVAALLQPLRRRIQHVVDRRFYRQRYDAARTLEAFSAHLREEVDLDTLGAELLGVVRRTLEPTTATVWFKQVERGR